MKVFNLFFIVLTAFGMVSCGGDPPEKKAGRDFMEDQKKYSDELAKNGIKSFDDLTKNIAKKNELKPEDVTEEMISEHIKGDEKKMQEIESEAKLKAEREANKQIENYDLETVFKGNETSLKIYKKYLSYAPSRNNFDVLQKGVFESTKELEGIIKSLKRQGNVVPKSLLY